MLLKVKPIKQLLNHCGPCCVKMILKKYGIKITQKELGIICNMTDTGVAPTAIVRCFKKYGIYASYKHYPGIRKSVEDYLEEYKNPIIIGTEEHYLLIVGYTEKMFYVIDPADGKQSLMEKEVVHALMKDMIIIKRKIGDKNETN